MKKLLHIIATPRGEQSRTLAVSRGFLECYRKNCPGCKVEEINLFERKLPEMTGEKVDGKYELLLGRKLENKLSRAWRDVKACIEEFLSADVYLISSPMWNFSVPYVLKHYIDIIVQPGYLFKYTEDGPQGLLKNKKMVVVTSRGGDYSAESPFHSYDYQENYLRGIFGFTGISDIVFVNAQPMDALGESVREEKIKEARRKAVEFAEQLLKDF